MVAVVRLTRPLRRTLFSPHPLTPLPLHKDHEPVHTISHMGLFQTTSCTQKRSYLSSELRESAVRDNLLRLLRTEIQYELDHSPPQIPVSKFYSLSVDHRPGEQWITLKTKFADNEEVKIEATMFDGEVPIPNSTGGGPKDEVELHITCIVFVSKGGNDVMEILCSAYPDRIEIKKLFVSCKGATAADRYDGPDFKELDDRLQDAVYDFLEARGIDDDLAAFLHKYMKNKEKTEYIRWLGTVKSYIDEK